MQGGGGATVKDDPETEQRVADGVNDTATASADKSVKKPGIDPFDNEQSDPIKSNAMSKCLFPLNVISACQIPAFHASRECGILAQILFESRQHTHYCFNY